VFDKFPRYSKNILLVDFNTKVDREEISTPTIENDNLHEINNDGALKVIKFCHI
jgi:hypothetical protein